jgi:hypothetical protein
VLLGFEPNVVVKHQRIHRHKTKRIKKTPEETKTGTTVSD